MPNPPDPISLRLSPDRHERVQKVADQIGLPKHSLSQGAIAAAVHTIEKDHGLVWPIAFTVERVPRLKAKPKKNRAVVDLASGIYQSKEVLVQAKFGVRRRRP